MATTKKNTRVDDRETFVSIKQSLGDNSKDDKTEEQLKTLYQIQKLDSQIDQINLMCGELPKEVQDIQNEIDELTETMDNLKREIKDYEKEISDYKRGIDESKEKTAKYVEQQKNVQNNREFESLGKEIEFQGLECMSLEKKIRRSQDTIAQKKAEYDEAKNNASGRKQDLDNKKKELSNITEETSKERKKLQDKVDALSKGLDERMVAAYHRVRDNAKNKLAVVTVKRESCGGCFNKIPPQMQIDIESGRKFIVCEYCGRILVSSRYDQEENSKDDAKNAK
ncbi:MAG: C4-type zinc ribbon domain-containing protein [Bacteroidales bacterium]|jgi:predicted  nucleic acid-binding Zn-ribbon protein